MKSSIALTALLACAAALPALAQQYPARPVRFITVGADDAMPRLVAQELAAPLGQQVYAEDHPGASGTIGSEVAARAAPDGYSLMVATTTHMVTEILRHRRPALAQHQREVVVEMVVRCNAMGDGLRFGQEYVACSFVDHVKSFQRHAHCR